MNGQIWLSWSVLFGFVHLLIAIPSFTDATLLELGLWNLLIEGLTFLGLLWRVGPPNLSERQLIFMISWLHISWWFAPPVSSEDVWRYLWDGAVWWQGMPTYYYAPNAPIFDALSLQVDQLADLRSQIGHAHLSTIYPPGAQQIFRIVTGLGTSLFMWRFSILVAQLLSFRALFQLSQGLGKVKEVAVLPLLCPIWVFDCALGAHLDAWAICFGLWGLVYTRVDQEFRAGLFFGIGVSIKLIPALWGFVVMVRYGFEHSWRSVGLLLGGGICGLALTCGSELTELWSIQELSGAQAYQQGWIFNDSLFSMIRYGLEWIGLEKLDARRLTQLCLMLCLCFTPIFIFWKKFEFEKVRHLLTFEVLTIGTILLFIGSPVVYSWYLGWLIMSLPFVWGNSWSCHFILTWIMIIPISYVPRLSVLSGGDWDITPMWRVIEYLSLGLILAIRTRYTSTKLLQHIFR